jgi:DHA2 family multidrug resistance protein
MMYAIGSATMTAEITPDESVAEEERPLGLRQLLAFTGMTIGMFLAVLNIQIVGSSFAEIQAGLAAGRDEVSWVLTSAMIAEVIVIPLSGWLSRMLSTRWLFTISSIGFTLASIACANAWNIESMIVFRALQGFSGGAMAPMVFATVYSAFPVRHQTTLTAIVSLLGTGAVALGPSLGGWISEVLSWHYLFLFNVPFGIIATVLVITLVDFDKPNMRLMRRIDAPGIGLLAVFFISLLIVLEEGRREDWFDSSMIVSLVAVAVVAGILLLWRELACKHPVIDLRVFKNRNFAVGAFYIFVFGAGLFVPLYLLPLFLSRILGLNTFQIGTWLFVLGISMMVAGFVMPTLLKLFKRRVVAFFGFSLLALGTWLQGDLAIETDFVSLLMPQIIRGFATQMCFLSMIGLAIGLLPVNQVKDGTALFQLTMRLGAAIGVAIANSYLVIRSEVHYQAFRDRLTEGHAYAGDMFDAFSGALGPGLGESPETAVAGIQVLVTMVEREAMVHAFNDITIVVALFTAASLVLMPLVRSVRKPGQ